MRVPGEDLRRSSRMSKVITHRVGRGVTKCLCIIRTDHQEHGRRTQHGNGRDAFQYSRAGIAADAPIQDCQVVSEQFVPLASRRKAIAEKHDCLGPGREQSSEQIL